MSEYEELVAEARRWLEERRILSAQEESGNFPHANEWEASDDWASDIVQRLAGGAP